MKLDTLSWVAKFQSAFQVYYIMRILGHELDESTTLLNQKLQQKKEERLQDSFPPDVNSRLTVDEGIRPVSSKVCVLCLDPMTHPAVIPCGHTFCWNCIFPFANKQSSSTVKGEEDGENGGEDEAMSTGCACPICRVEFTKFKIRALHAYM